MSTRGVSKIQPRMRSLTIHGPLLSTVKDNRGILRCLRRFFFKLSVLSVLFDFALIVRQFCQCASRGNNFAWHSCLCVSPRDEDAGIDAFPVSARGRAHKIIPRYARTRKLVSRLLPGSMRDARSVARRLRRTIARRKLALAFLRFLHPPPPRDYRVIST